MEDASESPPYRGCYIESIAQKVGWGNNELGMPRVLFRFEGRASNYKELMAVRYLMADSDY